MYSKIYKMMYSKVFFPLCYSHGAKLWPSLDLYPLDASDNGVRVLLCYKSGMHAAPSQTNQVQR